MPVAPVVRRCCTAAAALLVTAPLVSLAGASPASAAVPLPDVTSAHGSAIGSSALLTGPGLPSVRSSGSALQTLPCLTPGGTRSYDNHVASVHVAAPGQVLLDAGTATDTGTTSRSRTTLDAQEQATAASVSLLDGMVTATAVTARAHVTQVGVDLDDHSTADGTGTADGTSAAQFVGLQVNGNDVPVPAPGSSLVLPGVGTLYVGEVTALPQEVYAPTGQKRSPGVQVTGLRLHVDDLGGLSGDMVVARAVARADTSAGVLSGAAYGATAGVDPVGGTGRESLALMPCRGTGGKDRVSTAAGGVVPAGPLGDLLRTGTTTATINGLADGTTTRATVSETVQDVSVLAGVVKADAVTVRAETTGGSAITSAASTQLLGLTVAGTPVPATVPGQRIDLPGLGYVAFDEQVCTADGVVGPCTAAHRGSVEVVGIHVVVTAPANPLGVPVGTQVRIGSARSGARQR